MQVRVARQRVLEKVNEVVSTSDEATTARTLDYARAVLIALATRGGDEDVVLEELAVSTNTAALILRLHPEYLRAVLRRGLLPATKENGEYRLRLVDLVASIEGRAGMSPLARRMAWRFSPGWPLWQRRQLGQEHGETESQP